MVIDNLFDRASSVMTVISFITFIGIMWWAFSRRNTENFAEAAQLPFADEETPHV
ncbi:MAG: cbb3-type cytochrome c oxidase subunit 3 [Pseudomonadota bacterium]|jgi:cytochrome c oxidase cbb3-type subunit 4